MFNFVKIKTSNAYKKNVTMIYESYDYILISIFIENN